MAIDQRTVLSVRYRRSLWAAPTASRNGNADCEGATQPAARRFAL
jgi:hypothetical protein